MKIALNHIELDSLVRKHIANTGLVTEAQTALAVVSYERTRGGRMTATIDLDPPETSEVGTQEEAAEAQE